MKTTEDPRKGQTSASNATADRLCPGRHLAQAGLPERESELADSGRRIHALLAGQSVEGVTPKEGDIAAQCSVIEAKLVSRLFPTKPPKYVVREQRYWIKFKDPSTPNGKEYEHSGQADFVSRLGSLALIIDYKSAWGEVAESPRNEQLRDLAVLVRAELLTVTEIAVAIVQPLVTHEPEVCLYTTDDLNVAAIQMMQRVAESHNPNAPRMPGELQCAYCKARQNGACIEHQRWAGAMVPGMLSVLDVPVKDWTPEQREVFCDKHSIAQKWLDETWEAMRHGAEIDPGFVPGYALKPGNTIETINNPQQCFDRFAALGGTLEKFLDCMKIAKAKLRNRLSEVTGRTGKALDQTLDALTDGIVDKTQNRPSLVKANKIKKGT